MNIVIWEREPLVGLWDRKKIIKPFPKDATTTRRSSGRLAASVSQN